MVEISDSWCHAQLRNIESSDGCRESLKDVVANFNTVYNEDRAQFSDFFNKFIPVYFKKYALKKHESNANDYQVFLDQIQSIISKIVFLSLKESPKLSDLVYLFLSKESTLWRNEKDANFRFSKIWNSVNLSVLSEKELNYKSIYSYEVMFVFIIEKKVNFDKEKIMSKFNEYIISITESTEKFLKVDCTPLSNTIFLLVKHEKMFPGCMLYPMFKQLIELSMETSIFDRQILSINIIECFRNDKGLFQMVTSSNVLSIIKFCLNSDIANELFRVLSEIIRNKPVEDELILEFLEMSKKYSSEQSKYIKFIPLFFRNTNNELKNEIIEKIIDRENFSTGFVIEICKIDSFICSHVIGYYTNKLNNHEDFPYCATFINIALKEIPNLSIRINMDKIANYLKDDHKELYAEIIKNALMTHSVKLDKDVLTSIVSNLLDKNDLELVLQIVDILLYNGSILHCIELVNYLICDRKLDENSIKVTEKLASFIALSDNNYENSEFMESLVIIMTNLFYVSYKQKKEIINAAYEVIYKELTLLDDYWYFYFYSKILQKKRIDIGLGLLGIKEVFKYPEEAILKFVNFLLHEERKLLSHNAYNFLDFHVDDERFAIKIYVIDKCYELMVKNSTFIGEICDFISATFNIPRRDVKISTLSDKFNELKRYSTIESSNIANEKVLYVAGKRMNSFYYMETNQSALDGVRIFEFYQLFEVIEQNASNSNLQDMLWDLLCVVPMPQKTVNSLSFSTPLFTRYSLKVLCMKGYEIRNQNPKKNKTNNDQLLIHNVTKEQIPYEAEALDYLAHFGILNDTVYNKCITNIKTKSKNSELMMSSLNYLSRYFQKYDNKYYLLMKDKELCKALFDFSVGEEGETGLSLLIQKYSDRHIFFETVYSFVDFNSTKKMKEAIKLLNIVITKNTKIPKDMINEFINHINDTNQSLYCDLFQKIVHIRSNIELFFDCTLPLCKITMSIIETQCLLYPIISRIFNENSEKRKEIISFYDSSLSHEITRWGFSVEKKTEFRGLRNLGATCYMSSVLQQLFFIQKIRKMVVNYIPQEVNEHNKAIMNELKELFLRMELSKAKMCDTEKFFHCFPYDQREQRDSFEFLDTLLASMPSQISNNFLCKSSNILTGIKEKFEEIKPNESFHIMLPVSGFKKFEEAFASLSTPTCHVGNDMYDHQKLGKVEANQKEIINSLPNILVIQLARFDYSNGFSKKLNNYFEFPLKFNSSIIVNKPKEYTLIGIVTHAGTYEAGHYCSIINRNNEWYLFDDTNVEKIENFKVDNYFGNENAKGNHPSAYMLFYAAKQGMLLRYASGNFSSEIKSKIDQENEDYCRTQCLFTKETKEFIFHLDDFSLQMKYFINVYTHASGDSCDFQEIEGFEKVLKKNPNKSIEFFKENVDKIIACIRTALGTISNVVVKYICVPFSKVDCEKLIPFIETISLKMNENIINWRSFPFFGKIIHEFVSLSAAHKKAAISKGIIQNIVNLIDSFYNQANLSEVFQSEVDFSEMFNIIFDCAKEIDNSVFNVLSKHKKKLLKSAVNKNFVSRIVNYACVDEDFSDMLKQAEINDLIQLTKGNKAKTNELVEVLSKLDDSQEVTFTNLIPNILDYPESILIAAITCNNSTVRNWAEESINSMLGINNLCDRYITAEMITNSTNKNDVCPFANFPQNPEKAEKLIGVLSQVFEDCSSYMEKYNMLSFLRVISKAIACGGLFDIDGFIELLANSTNAKQVVEVLRIFLEIINMAIDFEFTSIQEEIIPYVFMEEYVDGPEMPVIFGLFATEFFDLMDEEDLQYLIEFNPFVSALKNLLEGGHEDRIRKFVSFINQNLSDEITQSIISFVTDNTDFLVYPSSKPLIDLVSMQQIRKQLSDEFALNFFCSIFSSFDSFSKCQFTSKVCSLLCEHEFEADLEVIDSFVDLVLSYPSNQNNSLKIVLDIACKNKSITEGFKEYIKEKMRDVERSGGNQLLLWKLRAMYLVLSGNEEEINSSVYDLIANRELFESEAGYFFVEVISLVIKAYSKWPDVIYAVIKKNPMNELTRKFISRYDFMYQNE